MMYDQKKALRLLARCTMRDFTKTDWYGFAGCETKDPMIGEVDEHTLILDGDVLLVLDKQDLEGGTEGVTFKLKINSY